MYSIRRAILVLPAAAIFGLAGGAMADESAADEIRLIVQGDDIGCAHAANQAVIKCHREGVLTTTEVMVPCPWFEEAARLLNENPKIEVGVHLTLTSEWEVYKWRPLTVAPSLTNEDGYFYQVTKEWNRWPAGTGFLDAEPKADEVEKELRAQIELAKKKIRNVTHVTAHMGTATSRPDLRAIVIKLAKEYGLRPDLCDPKLREKHRLRFVRGFGKGTDPVAKREAMLVGLLEQLKPGNWILLEHPALDTPEMRAIGHEGYENVAEDRQGVTELFTSEKVKDVIRRRGIRLISYSDLEE